MCNGQRSKQNPTVAVLTRGNEYYTTVGVLNLVELFEEAVSPGGLFKTQTSPTQVQIKQTIAVRQTPEDPIYTSKI